MSRKPVPKMKPLSYLLIYILAVYPLHPAIGVASQNNTETPSYNDTTVVTQHYKVTVGESRLQRFVPVVNIARPDDTGVTHILWSDLNISGGNDLVFNNAVSETALSNVVPGGQVWANPNFDGKAANLIINEVRGGTPSQLEGTIEVAGQKAAMVIANENGITCDPCQFINTSGVTLTTGEPILNRYTGELAAIGVQKGTVTVGAKGIDATNADYLDIISRATVLNGEIRAKNLALTQGANRVDFLNQQVTPIKEFGEKPQLAVDTRAMGGMYADKIRLVGTEKGVGVNLKNLVTTRDD
ncbi:filamentous hemagglutinin N-terminal domain-containing protein, partial [Xenorhabdus bovienii]|uniref:filamentous hemagglutinin N-terminal domain-containing protein n=1 Tax=Xenorhabdus bovienii TaxID=40576 RepID=UPI00237CD115